MKCGDAGESRNRALEDIAKSKERAQLGNIAWMCSVWDRFSCNCSNFQTTWSEYMSKVIRCVRKERALI